MTENLKIFPSVNKVKILVEKFNEITWPSYSSENDVNNYVKEISDILKGEFEFLFDYKIFLKSNEFPLNIFRVRELDSIININLIAEHSYPPIKFTNFGRCNFPNYPVFYCADNPVTALFEVIDYNDTKNKNYCISKWELFPSDREFIFQSFLQTNLHPYNNFQIIKKSIEQRINEPFEYQLTKDQKEGLLELLKFLHDIFINDTNYNLSATLAYRALYAPHNLPTDILMYPSVKTKLRGANMAIRPNFVDNMMRLKRLYVVNPSFNNVAEEKLDVSIIKYANIIKNSVIWDEVSNKNNVYMECFNEDFGNCIQ